MIPFEYDDGFSIPVADGFARPMLRAGREQLRGSLPEDWKPHLEFIFKPPYYFGDQSWRVDDNARDAIIYAVLVNRDELKTFNRLKQEIDLLVRYPGLMQLSCQDCRTFATNPETGAVLVTQSGAPILRKLPTPCEVTSCPKGHWKDPVTVSTLTQKVWRHYWRMKAARASTDCPLMARNWAYIDWVVDHGRRPELNPDPFGGYGGS